MAGECGVNAILCNLLKRIVKEKNNKRKMDDAVSDCNSSIEYMRFMNITFVIRTVMT